MQLNKKKALAARVLKIGEGRIVFNGERLDEIKEAITKQDIRDLKKSGAIIVKQSKGRKANIKRKRRRMGSIRKRKNESKREYINITRKLRAYIYELLKQGGLSREQYELLRREIRARTFRSKAHIKERIVLLKKDLEGKDA